MRIGIDIDGTITDLHKEIIRYGMQYNDKIVGKGIKNENAYKIIDIFDWDENECLKLKKYIQREILNIIKPREDVCKYFKEIKSLGHDIYIITGRKSNEMKNTYQETLDWLKFNNIPFDKLIIEENNKGIACVKNKIDIFVDDSTKHLKRVYDAGIKELYIFDNVYNKENYQYKRIYSFYDLYDIIKTNSCKNN